MIDMIQLFSHIPTNYGLTLPIPTSQNIPATSPYSHALKSEIQ